MKPMMVFDARYAAFACEEHIGWEWVEEAAIEPNEEFDCPECKATLMYKLARLKLKQK